MSIFKEYRFLYALPVAMLVLCLFGLHRANITVTPIADPTIIVLPEPLKQRIITETDSELFYVDYHNKTLKYYFKSQNVVRTKIILKAMQKLIVSLRYKFLDGNYLFVLHDGAHHTYGYPILAYATKKPFLTSKQVVLIPDPYATIGYRDLFRAIDKYLHKYNWAVKKNKIFWRGSAFGVGPECNDLNGCERFRFMNYVATLDFVDAKFTSYTSQLNPEFKARLAAIHSLTENVKPSDSQAYKYLIDIDGNSCSYSRMAWILYSNSVLMKHQSDLMQWYYLQLKEMEHYIPINADFTNLQMQYIWAETHPTEAKAIAENGRKLAKQIFSSQGILKSMEQAFLEYHALVTTD